MPKGTNELQSWNAPHFTVQSIYKSYRSKSDGGILTAVKQTHSRTDTHTHRTDVISHAGRLCWLCFVSFCSWTSVELYLLNGPEIYRTFSNNSLMCVFTLCSQICNIWVVKVTLQDMKSYCDNTVYKVRYKVIVKNIWLHCKIVTLRDIRSHWDIRSLWDIKSHCKIYCKVTLRYVKWNIKVILKNVTLQVQNIRSLCEI